MLTILIVKYYLEVANPTNKYEYQIPLFGGALKHSSVSQRPLGFGFGTKGSGAKRVWGQGLTTRSERSPKFAFREGLKKKSYGIFHNIGSNPPPPKVMENIFVKPWPQTLSPQTLKSKTKGPWADTKISWATHPPHPPTYNFKA